MNLETAVSRKQLSQQLKSEIDKWCSDTFDDGPRGHLGASQIGNSCSRALWYAFRWVAHKKHDGRQQRLFQRGHFEEPRFCSYLEGVGFKVTLFDKVLLWHPESECLYYGPESDCSEGYVNDVDGVIEYEQMAKEKGIWLDKGKRQIRISGCNGHFGGSIDGIGEHLVYGKFLTEFKTQGTGKKFTELKEKGVKLSKPVHYSQMSVYGYKLGLKYAIYMAVNKNDDDLHVEVVELDWKLGEDLIRKAEFVINSETPPSRIAESPAYFECAWCDFISVCHKNTPALINCRSCKNAKPVEDSQWLCIKHSAVIPKSELNKQYECYESIV